MKHQLLLDSFGLQTRRIRISRCILILKFFVRKPKLKLPTSYFKFRISRRQLPDKTTRRDIILLLYLRFRSFFFSVQSETLTTPGHSLYEHGILPTSASCIPAHRTAARCGRRNRNCVCLMGRGRTLRWKALSVFAVRSLSRNLTPRHSKDPSTWSQYFSKFPI